VNWLLDARSPGQVPDDVAAGRALLRRARTTGRARGVAVGLVLVVLGFGAFCVSVSLGNFPIPLRDVVPALFGFGDPQTDFIVRELRLPRAVLAVLVGIAFATSGAIFQSLAHNPLASPDIIGITAGASATAVVVIVVLHGSGPMLSVGAFVGALTAAAAIYLLAYKRGVSAYRLVLVGIGVAALLGSFTAYLLTTARIGEVQRASVWLTGSLNGRGWEYVEPLAWSLAVLVPLALALVPALRVLQLGDDTAKGLGLRVEAYRAALVLVGVGLAAVATAAAGPIAFVAFVCPPIARRLVDAPLTVVPAALVGAVLVLGSDLIGRTATGAIEMPVGIITGIIGAPYLLYLLARANRIGRGG
jgi:iron complex transport system permease protein